MIRARCSRLRRCAAAAVLLAVVAGSASAQVAAQKKAPNQGQFFTVEEPLQARDQLETLQNSTLECLNLAAKKGSSPILIFEFLPGKDELTETNLHSAIELAEHISTKLGRAKQTIAYVPESLSGFAVLPVLACDEIVMGPKATLGPITPKRESPSDLVRTELRSLAARKGRELDLLLGLLDPDAPLRKLRTNDRQLHFVLESNLAEFAKSHVISENEAAWEGGRKGILTAQTARLWGVIKLEADNRAVIQEAYGLPSNTDNPLLGANPNGILIKIDGPIDTVKQQFISARIERAAQKKINIIFFEINSQGGLDIPAVNIAMRIANLRGVRTVAYVNDRALGVASLVALACDDIALAKGAQLGDVTKLLTGSFEQQDMDAKLIAALSDTARDLARRKGHSEAIAMGMVDPSLAISQADDTTTGAVVCVLDKQVETEPGRYRLKGPVKKVGEVITLSPETAQSLGFSRWPAINREELVASYGVRSRLVEEGPTWVDSLVSTLTTTWMTWLLLFVGMFMLILELKLPGVGLPGIISALAFLLFFWGHFMGGTADKLEILLFLVGIVCLALELFVFPGFAVFGICGILLVLTSVVMACHTFVWPSQEYEYRQMASTIVQVTVALVTVAAGAIVLGRYFPSMPLFNRMILVPQPAGGPFDEGQKPALDPENSLAFLLGETGRATTTLRPTGKARFGNFLADVIADGAFIEANTAVEVIDVQGTRVLVAPARHGGEPGSPILG